MVHEVRRCQRLPDVTLLVDSTRPVDHHIKSRTHENANKSAHSHERDVL